MKEQQRKYNLIALVGKSGAGKDTVLKKVLEQYPFYHRVVLNTTRPMREGEIDGVDYHFNTLEQFTEIMMSGEMITVKKYREWFYGISEDAFISEITNIGCFSPEELFDIISDDRFNVIIFEICAPDHIRLERSIERTPHMCDEICRRFLQDKEDFKKIEFTADYRISNCYEQDLKYIPSTIVTKANKIIGETA